jgi:cytochrome P450
MYSLTLPDWEYKILNDPFDRIGSSFIAVTPNRYSMWTNSAEVMRQVTARREAFPKDTDNYRVLAIFGESVLTTEGALWRMHRKVTAASFNEKNASRTFVEAINQTQGMLSQWTGPGGEGTGKTITTVEHDTMTLALNIIGYVGFGLRLLWPGQTLPADTDPKLVKYGSPEPPAGHTLTFATALSEVLHRIVAILLVPDVLLKNLPFQWARLAWDAKSNYMQYMDEFLKEKIEEVRKGDDMDKEGMDIMGQLVRAKYGSSSKDASDMSDSDIIGNAFIMIVAGHETTANTLHFTLLELANNPAAQRQLQKDIDAIFGDSDPSKWNYEQSVNAMLASYLGACMNETLRLMPAVVNVPKHVSPAQDQVITVDGAKFVLPAGMAVGMSVVCVHRNPRYWPTRPSRVTPGKAHDLDDYEPERWYRKSLADSDGGDVEGGDTEDFGGFRGPDTSASLFRPVRGSFLPFSDGARSCLGRRIAQVEMIAALAVIFQKYSLELAVDKWADDDEVAYMSPEGRKTLYKKAQDSSRDILRQATSVLTLKLHGSKHVPIRLVRRGEERFVDIVDLHLDRQA